MQARGTWIRANAGMGTDPEVGVAMDTGVDTDQAGAFMAR